MQWIANEPELFAIITSLVQILPSLGGTKHCYKLGMAHQAEEMIVSDQFLEYRSTHLQSHDWPLAIIALAVGSHNIEAKACIVMETEFSSYL